MEASDGSDEASAKVHTIGWLGEYNSLGCEWL